MSRIEFMNELSALLQDIPSEDRQDALAYYEDYFEEAGTDREQEVIKELGSPRQVALTIKTNLESADKGEFTENGYRDPNQDNNRQQVANMEETKSKGTRGDNNKIMKIVLIVLIIIVGSPVIIPLAVGIIGLVIGLLAAAFGIFLALIITSVSLVVVGIALIVVGVLCIVPEVAAAIALIGSGSAIAGIGLLATYGSVKLCMLTFPPMIRFIIDLCKKPFNRKAVA